jgi:hypothetical protein
MKTHRCALMWVPDARRTPTADAHLPGDAPRATGRCTGAAGSVPPPLPSPVIISGSSSLVIPLATISDRRPSVMGPEPAWVCSPPYIAERQGLHRLDPGSHEHEKGHNTQGEQRRRHLPPGDHHRVSLHGARSFQASACRTPTLPPVDRTRSAQAWPAIHSAAIKGLRPPHLPSPTDQ